MYCGFITTLKNVRKHPNADKLMLAECYDNTVCVGLNSAEGEIGIYFPVDGQLSEEFCKQHDLVRRKDENGNPAGGYLDPEKRNVKAVKLRGEKSDGLFMPLSCLVYTGINLDDLDIGTQITVVNGHEICQKYIPKSNSRSAHSGGGAGNHTRKHKDPVAPLFAEHADTEQLVYNLSTFKPGDEIEITLKMHGTSQRTGHLPILKGYADSWAYRVGNAFRHMLNKIDNGHREDIHDGKPIYDYGYISGTRRVIMEDFEGGFYGSNEFREQHAKKFEGKLMKGETVYYEVVSFTNDGTPIMGKAKVPKEAQKEYGNEMIFHYGLSENSDIYVYRMTMTNEDGFVVEYTPDFMRYRCEQMGVKTVPVFWKGTIPEHCFYATVEGQTELTPGEWIKTVAEQYYDGPDPIGKTHVREGVVIRIINRPKFTAYKHKNFLFKQITGIIKDNSESINSTMTEDILAEL